MTQMSLQPAYGTLLQRASISFATTGDNIIIAAVAGQIIQVYRIFFITTTAITLTFKDGASNALTGALPLAANGAITLDHSGDPWFVTTAGNAFILNQSGTSQVSGAVWFTQRS